MALVGGEKPHIKPEANLQGAEKKSVLETVRENKAIGWTMGAIAAGSAFVAFNLANGEAQPEEATPVATGESADGIDEESQALEPETTTQLPPKTDQGETLPSNSGEIINPIHPGALPEAYTEMAVEAERELYHLIRNGLDRREEVEPKDYSAWFLRGVYTHEIEKETGDSIFLRMTNPVQLTLGEENALYWIGYNQELDQLVGVDVGEETDDQYQYLIRSEGTIISLEEDPFSGQIALSQPLKLDAEGLTLYDVYADLLRDEENRLDSRADFYRDSNDGFDDDAGPVLDELLHIDEDSDKIYRDKRTLQSDGITYEQGEAVENPGETTD